MGEGASGMLSFMCESIGNGFQINGVLKDLFCETVLRDKN